MAAAGLWQWRAHERDGSAALARGLAALAKDDMRSARVELMNAIKGNPRNAEARAAQARVLVELGDGAGAQAEAERARALGQAAAATRAVMAQALFLQGDFAGALAEARAADLPEDQALAAAHVVVALQSIAARNVDPIKNAVVSVCTLRSDTDSHNVLPQTVRLRGTVRTLDAGIRDLVQDRLEAVVAHTCAAHQCTADIVYARGYPITVNADANTAYAADVAENIAPGVDRDTPPIMAGEDFSYMLNQRPGAYIMLGNGDGPTVHHPMYNFNDDAIPAGCSWFAEMIETRLPA